MVVGLLSLSISSTPLALGYDPTIQVGNTLMWQIETAPSDAFNMFYTGGGDWLAQNETPFTFTLVQ